MHTAFDIEGHRGCRGLMPENTWPAMKRALDLGVTTLEMDVVISADKQVLLSHEPWMGHEITTAPDGVI
ncbi:MAG: glycerophosphodiester phosphodiesterase, partial [Chitinophagaceae bacterium]|nr:glycerophosphodiester phosphodiesterase [Chitinophagaceae bacterium]